MSSDQATILLIDDEAAVRSSITDHLEDLGFRIVTAENGRAGIERFRSERVDLVLVDLRMPEMDGLEVLAYITQTAPETPLIVVSGTGVIADAVEALHRGAWDYLLKPIEDFSILAHAIETNLEKARLRKENLRHQQHLEQMVAERTLELKEANEQLTHINTRLRESEQQFRLILDNFGKTFSREDTQYTLAVPLNPEQSFLVGLANKIIGACDAMLAFVERRLQGSEKLLEGSKVHGPVRLRF